MKEKKRIVIGFMIVILIVAGSYLFQNLTIKLGLSSAKIIKVTEKGKVVAYISVSVLRQLMQQDLADEDNVTIGPPLLTAINSTGESAFNEVEVIGKGDKKDIILGKKDIYNDMILYLADNGTINLCRKDKALNYMVTEVTEIRINN
jgi:hypothetical protein